MKNITLTFIAFVIYPMTIHAGDSSNQALFDTLPIKSSEIQSVSNLFWNAQSIQDKVKQSIPSQHRDSFRNSSCNIQTVIKTEGSAEACELNDDPEKMGKFIYNFSVACGFGNYQVEVCSREENKLLNQLKVTRPEHLVSDENPFDLDSTM